MLCRKHLLLLIVSSFFWTSVLYAQNKQANNWYFGQYAGITFNTPDGSPQVVFDGKINQIEGCASISDSEGNLLFYTDGMTVWNNEHDTLQNGDSLMGHPSSSMSAIIVPWPLTENKYYIFTVPQTDYDTSLRYSIVNMDLDGGKGGIIPGKKNIFLTKHTHEKVTAVKHANNTSIWVVTHLWNTNEFQSFLVDADSLHTQAVSSFSGNIANNPAIWFGYMKISPKGNFLVLGSNSHHVQIHRFNKYNGEVYDPVTILSAYWDRPYGFEFSPDENRLYVTYAYAMVNSLKQFTITEYDSVSINNSVYSFPNKTINGALQLGPDFRIYQTYRSDYLNIIAQPNEYGAACGYIDSAIFLDDGTGTYKSLLGLPAFIQSFFNYASFTWEGHCIGDTSFFAITDTASQDSVFWDFGDPASGLANYSDSFFPYHIYEDTGAYQVSVIGYNNNLNDTTVQEVFIHPLPVPLLPTDTGFCEGYGVNLWPGDFQSYLWQNGSTDTSFYADTTLSVIVEVTDVQGCKNLDTTQAVEHSKPGVLSIFHD